jgi:MFS family permease
MCVILTCHDRNLFKNVSFLLIFSAGAIGTFPLFVPPFFLPLYSRAIGLPTSTGAGLVAGFNLSSAVGRIASGLLCDRIGALNTVFISLMLSAISMLALWPASTTLAPLAAFTVINGAGNGGFFSTMPTVVGNIFGSARVSVAMGMVVTGWGGGYLMVCHLTSAYRHRVTLPQTWLTTMQGAPIAGYLLEAYGGKDEGLQAYRPAMFYAGSLALGSAGLVALMRFRLSKRLFAKF